MFIAHLPAGYLLTQRIQQQSQNTRFLWIGLLGSVFPDFDLLYFYLIDGRQHPHHDYWIHIPFYWLVIAVSSSIFLRVIRKNAWLLPLWIFYSNIFLHLVLDSLMGGIQWLFPFSEQSFYLFTVEARYPFWVFNFIFHWTFLLEISVIVLAIFVYCRQRKSKQFGD